jgi:poly-gamma-glutamate synthesis protein (capsule biosynthesis protein)
MPACDKSTWGYNQQGFFRHLIDLGADIVVGVSAHQPQTFELYGNGAIYYGLGNLFFDQTYWPGTERGLILTHYFIDGKHVQTRISPTVFDGNLQVSLMNEESSTWLLNRLANAR